MSGITRHHASPGARAWRAFQDWRRTRAFWGGLLVLLGGAEILFTVWAPLGVVLHVGMQNFIGYMVPFIVILLGLLIWFHPVQRIFYALIAMVCGLGSWLTSNMGGFILGLLLTVVGAALAFSWAPDETPAETPEPEPVAEATEPEPVAETPEPLPAPIESMHFADRNTPPPDGHWQDALPADGRPAWNAPGPRNGSAD